MMQKTVKLVLFCILISNIFAVFSIKNICAAEVNNLPTADAGGPYLGNIESLISVEISFISFKQSK